MKYITFTIFCFFVFSSCTTTEIPLVETPENTITYINDVKTIIDTNCIACHSSSGVANFLPLTNYNQVRDAAETRNLILRMNDVSNPMPQGGLLSPEIRAVIDKWKADGFLEN